MIFNNSPICWGVIPQAFQIYLTFAENSKHFKAFFFLSEIQRELFMIFNPSLQPSLINQTDNLAGVYLCT